MTAHAPLVCVATGELLDPDLRTRDGSRYPAIDGVAVVVHQPAVFMARHSPQWRTDLPWSVSLPEPLPVDAPDLLTPHLSPGELAQLARDDGAPAAWCDLLAGLDGDSPAAVCARWGAELAPDGPTLDLGCGVAVMGRLMAAQGRFVTLVDRSPRAVLMARDLLAGRLPEAWVPDERGGCRVLPAGYLRVADRDRLRFVVADALDLPFPPASFAWIHLGNLVDMVDGAVDGLLDGVADALMPGGLLTLSTPHDVDLPPMMGGVDPSGSLRDLLAHAGLDLITERDPVPWVVRQYRRGYRLLLADCLAARRPLQPVPGGRG